jgi:hypothetical protein
MPLRLLIAYGLIALLVLSAVLIVLRLRRTSRERNRTRRYLR